MKPANVMVDLHFCFATRLDHAEGRLLTLSPGLPADTPMWRPGPTRRNELCNACGIKWRRQRHQRTDTVVPSAARHKPAPSPAATVSNSQAEVQVRADLTDG